MKSLLHSKFVILALMAVVPAVASSYAECEQDAFIEEVNTAWVATNYPLIKQAITNRLAICTNDLLALGLQYEYYVSAEVDYTNSKTSAEVFILAVSNRAPSEVNNRRVPLGLPITISRETMPTNIPPVIEQARAEEQISHMHAEFSNEFPSIQLYQMLVGRIEALESGEVTEEELSIFNNPQ